MNAERSAFVCRKDPDQAGVKLMMHIRNNNGTGLSTTVEYQMISSDHNPDVPVVKWGVRRPEVTDENFDARTYVPDGKEEEVMFLTKSGPTSAEDVWAGLEEKPKHLNTLHKLMSRMAQKGMLRRVGQEVYTWSGIGARGSAPWTTVGIVASSAASMIGNATRLIWPCIDRQVALA